MLRNKILAVIGQGYVGLPLAMEAVNAGWQVIGIDNSPEKIQYISSGNSPVEDISDDQLALALKSGDYTPTEDFSEVSKASVVCICVPTPLDSSRNPDLSIFKAAVTSISPFIRDETLVVSESTSYPGTLRDVLVPIVHQLVTSNKSKVYFASAPERVNPGDKHWKQKNTPRIFGALDSYAEELALEFYGSICETPVLVQSPEVAETAKLLENTFRLVNIALINEFTQLCSAKGIDIQDVIDAASTKPYGFMPFRPGVGVGGHCIPVDPRYLSWWAKENGKTAKLVELADEINQEMPEYVANRALSLISKSIKNPRILIVGVAYKPGLSDVRESPVSDLKMHLLKRGAEVAWHDPLVKNWLNSNSVEMSWECDLAIIATAHPGLELEGLIKRKVRILDCTNTLRNVPDVTTI
jgi:UDP-N-acetyl-D-glucosamine dehydrogenase